MKKKKEELEIALGGYIKSHQRLMFKTYQQHEKERNEQEL